MKRFRKSPTDERQASMPQRLARRAALAFFVASIVPLAFLVFVVHRYVLPKLVQEDYASVATAMLLLAVLVLLSFLVMTEVNREAIHRIRTANVRLTSLLDATTILSHSAFADVIVRNALETAGRLVSADAGFACLRPPGGEQDSKPPEMFGSEAAKLFERRRQSFLDLAELVARERRTVVVDGQLQVPGADLLQAKLGETTLASVLAAPFLSADSASGAMILTRNAPHCRFNQEEIDLASILTRQTGIALVNAYLNEAQKNFFTHVTEILVDALDRHARHQAGHSQSVAYYSNLIGHELGFARERLQRLFFAALLHDIGMLRLPLDDPARVPAMREHPALAAEMLRPITVWSDLAPFVLHHHERFDGSGYPQGLKGEDIPLEARIIAVADALDAMTSPRSYQPPRSLASAAEEIEHAVGLQFDPRVVAALRSLVTRGELEPAPL